MAPADNPMDKLASVVDSLSTTNKALREVIQIRDDEIERLEHFESHFKGMRENFSQFRELAIKHENQADELQLRLRQHLIDYRKSGESLRGQIANLKDDIERQSLENELLDRELKDNIEKLQRLKYSNDQNNAYANSFPIVSSPNSFIQRLCDDLK